MSVTKYASLATAQLNGTVQLAVPFGTMYYESSRAEATPSSITTSFDGAPPVNRGQAG